MANLAFHNEGVTISLLQLYNARAEGPHVPPTVRDHTTSTVIFLVFNTILVILRHLAWYTSGLPVQIHDVFVLPAWIFCVTACGCILGATVIISDYEGRGSTPGSAATQELVPGAQVLYAVPFLYHLACICGRLSILALYLRVFPTRREQIASYMIMGLSIAYTVAAVVAESQLCNPMAKLWDTSLPGHCWDLYIWFKFIPMPNLVFDAVMLVIPLPGVWKLQTGLAMKVGLTLMFLAGSFLNWSFRATPLSESYDFNAYTMTRGLLSNIAYTAVQFKIDPRADLYWEGILTSSKLIYEAQAYLMAVCIVGLRPLFRALRKRGRRLQRPLNPNRSMKFFLNSFLQAKKIQRDRMEVPAQRDPAVSEILQEGHAGQSHPIKQTPTVSVV